MDIIFERIPFSFAIYAQCQRASRSPMQRPMKKSPESIQLNYIPDTRH